MKAIALIIALCSPAAAMASCYEDAGRRYAVDPDLLRAIGWQESNGHANAVGVPLKGGNRALGLMQINTVHLPELSKYEIDRESLFDGCKSINIGAWVLANCIKDVGRTWGAVGCYFAGAKSADSDEKTAYVESVQRHYRGYKRQSQKSSSDFVAGNMLVGIGRTNAESALNNNISHHEMVVWGSDE